MSKGRLNRVEMQVRLAAAARPSATLERVKSAIARGLIYCKDGKNRTPEEWLEYLPADLGEKVREALTEQNDTL